MGDELGSYNPLILTIDPKFLGHPSRNIAASWLLDKAQQITVQHEHLPWNHSKKHLKRLSVRQHMPSSKGTPELVNRYEIAELFSYSTWLCKIRLNGVDVQWFILLVIATAESPPKIGMMSLGGSFSCQICRFPNFAWRSHHQQLQERNLLRGGLFFVEVGTAG